MCYKYYQKYKLNSDADNFLTDEFDNVVNQTTDDPLYTDEQENQAIQEQTPKNGGTRGISSDALKYKGYNVAGKIEMPTVRLQYPILGDKVNGSWQVTDANAIEVSVAIQYGVGLNQVGNTVIVGHNYRNGLFFSNNKKLSNGDSVYITDNSGNKVKYIIYNKYETTPEDTDYMLRDTAGKREVSLSTCTDDSSKRLIIWAKAEEDQ